MPDDLPQEPTQRAMRRCHVKWALRGYPRTPVCVGASVGTLKGDAHLRERDYESATTIEPASRGDIGLDQ